jgi:ubiquinone/menaquinone biosynthesis C-methylase UbiE
VWECGAGSGQATTDLADRFDEVVATDVSAEQLRRAPARARIHRVVAAAEATPIASSCIDVVAIAQALHWFDHERFYAEVRRVATPGAAIVAWSYGSPKMEGAVGDALDRLMFETLRGYWPPEREHIIAEYRTIPFPFERLVAPSLSLIEEWTLARVAGYARSWSATVQYVAAHGTDPVATFESEARRHWANDEPRSIVWPLAVLAGRVTTV